MTPRAMRLTLIAAACLAHCAATGQVATDASLGQAAKSLAGPAYQIPQTLGKLAGNNLFHSFQTFNIGSGESANFSTTTPGIANVVSRVTGGAPSTINGQINFTAAAGRPSFYFINPAGVTFGHGAEIDVPGAFHVSTANTLRFADGSSLHADPAAASSFSSAAPESFGFLGASRATIAVRDGALLLPRIGRTMSLVGGDIVLDNATAAVVAGDLRVAAVGQTPVVVGVAGALPVLAGTVSLSNDAYLQVENYNELDAGKLTLGAGSLSMDFSSIFSTAHVGASGRGGAIDIALSGALLGDAQSTIRTVAEGSAPGGAISIQARQVSLRNTADVTSLAQDAGEGGAISIQAHDVGLSSEANIYSAAAAGGKGGAISLAASGSVLLTGGASTVLSVSDGSGQGGDVTIRANDIAVTGGADVTSAAQSAGRGGAVLLDAARYLDMHGAKVQAYTLDSGAGGALTLRAGTDMLLENAFAGTKAQGDGAGGALSLAGGAITLADKSVVVSDGTGLGQGGRISIATPASFKLEGESTVLRRSWNQVSASLMEVRVGSMDIGGGSELVSAGLNSGAVGGNIDVLATGAVKLHDGGRIMNYGFGSGTGGQIKVSAASVALEGGGYTHDSGIASGADESDQTHNSAAGNITVAASGAISLSKGSYIDSGNYSDAKSGDISLSAQDIRLDSARITNGALSGTGNGGDIGLTAGGHLEVSNHSLVSTGTLTTGNSGAVHIAAANATISGGSTISTSAFTPTAGFAGNIDMAVQGKLTVTGTGSVIDSSTSAASPAGAIRINAGELLLEQSGAISSYAFANGANGRAGSIDLNVARLMAVNSGATISTTTLTNGEGGAIHIHAGEAQIGGGRIHSQAEVARGAAGSIELQVTGDLRMTSGDISSSSSAGAAGSVKLGARNIKLSGTGSIVSATAFAGSSGQTGNLDLVAGEAIRISDGARVLMQNQASVANPGALLPTRIRMAAPLIELHGGDLSVNAFGNASASAIQISSGVLRLTNSDISTSANLGNGGPITIDGGALVALNNSVITTSVTGASGNGGDIRIGADALLLNTGFIQANTAAANASGGLVNIDTRSLVSSGSTLFVGGQQPFTFTPGVFGLNVIQAAAPTGVSGTISINSPVLDVSGSLRGLNAQALDTGGLGRDPCQATAGSSLVQTGRGGLPPSARGLLGPPDTGSLALAGTPVLAALAPGGCR